MSNSLELELKVRTGAAKQASDDVAAAIHGVTDASEAAGKSTQKLGKQVAVTRGQQLEAVEALRRAKDAQSELTLTEAAYGKKSSEAAAAKKRLIAAQAEATKAAIVAASSLERVSKATTAAAKAEEGDLTPATKRAAAQIARMSKDAERAAGDLHRMELQAIASSKGTATLTKGLTAMQVAGGNLLAGGVSRAVTGIGDALSGSVKSAVDFEKQFTGVVKVLSDTSAENVTATSDGIKELAVSLGVLPTELAAMTQSLAASGLQDDLIGYTEDAAEMGVAFEMTGEQSGHAIASLSASLGLSRKEMQSLAGTANVISDNMNATGADMMSFLQNTAGIGRAANVSGETLLGLGASIIATGVDSDRASTGVKNLLATMEAGSAATKAQSEAFAKLGFDAVDVAEKMANGKAEETIKEMVAAVAKLPNEEKFGVLIALFGKESIASVGGLATNTQLLGQAFALAGDEAAAAGSIQAEYARVSETSGHKMEKLKAQVQVLAISLGDQLLPHVNRVVEFLSSPEGQDWGREAVSKAVGAVEGLITVVGAVASGFSSFSEFVGGADVALGAMGVTALALTGPLGAAAAAGASIGYGMAAAYDWAATKILGDTAQISAKMLELLGRASDIRHEEHLKEMAGIKAEMDADTAAQDQHYKNREKAEALAQRYEAAELKRLGHRASAEEKLAIQRKASQLQSAVEGGSRMLGGGFEEDRLANFEKLVEEREPARPKEKTEKEKKKAAAAGKKAQKAHDKEEKDAAKFAEDIYDFDADVAKYYAKLTKEIREEDIKSQEAAYEAAMSAEDKKHSAQLTALDREREILDAGLRAGEDATAAHESLLMRRIAADEAHARRQLKLAKTDQQREAAQTEFENAQHQRRVANLRRAQQAEEKTHAKKLAVISHANDLIGVITETTTSAVLDGALAQKGALWMILGEELKVTGKRFAIKAAGEFAQAAIAAATFNYPSAAAHAVAGGMAAGVAVLAGVGSVAATAIGDARGGGKEGGAESTEKSKTADAGGIDPSPRGASKSGGKGESGDTFEKSEIPQSFNDRNPAQSGGDGERVFNITVNVGNLMGKDSKQLGRDLLKAIREAEGAGKKV